MNLGMIREKLEKVPVMQLLAAYLAYLGYDYYNFAMDPSSPLQTKSKELAAAKEELTKVKDRVKKANEFFLTLNTKKAQLRNLAQQLEETKSSLSESVDVPELMKTLLIEAKRAGLEVAGLRPMSSHAQEYYAEQDFEFKAKGIFFQYVLFFDRISNLQRIVRVDNFAFKPISKADAKYVELEGSMQIKAFRYLGSKADELGEKNPAGKDKGKLAGKSRQEQLDQVTGEAPEGGGGRYPVSKPTGAVTPNGGPR